MTERTPRARVTDRVEAEIEALKGTAQPGT